MPVDAHDHLACGHLQALVQGVWHHALRVVKQLDEGVFGGVLPDDVSRMVSTSAVDKEHLQLIRWIILLQNRRDALLNELFFIEKWANN